MTKISTTIPNDLRSFITNNYDHTSYSSIARQYRVGINTARRWVSELGLVLLDANEIKKNKSIKLLPPDGFKGVCIELIKQERFHYKVLREKYNVDQYIIERWLINSGIDLPTERYNTPTPVDFHDQFNKQTSKSQLGKHYNVSLEVVERWLLSEGLKYDDPIPDPFDVDDLINMHSVRGMTPNQIASKFNVSVEMVRSRLRKNKITNNQYIDLVSRELLYKLHHEDRLTQHEIAEMLGIHQTTISIYMKKFDIPVLIIKNGSAEQRQVEKFIEQHYSGKFETQRLWGYEYDIVIPEFNLAIEYHGLRWHTEEFQRNKHNHYNKLKAANENNYRLISIFSDEWYYKKNIVQSIILNHLRLTPHKIFARKCQVREISSQLANVFYNNNHIQGETRRNKLNVGLYHDNNLVACMTFGLHPRNNQLTLSRYCTVLNTNVVGGASKLFKYCVNELNVNRIISWSDNRWSEGNLYNTLGFKLKAEIPPSYQYVTPNKLNRLPAQNFQKKKLKIDDGITEVEYMKSQNYYRIWDCGKKTWEWKRGA